MTNDHNKHSGEDVKQKTGQENVQQKDTTKDVTDRKVEQTSKITSTKICNKKVQHNCHV